MSTETTTEVAEVAVEAVEAVKPAAKKPAARKPAAKKAAPRQTAARKAAAKPAAKEVGKGLDGLIPKVSLKASREKIKQSADKAQALIKSVVYAQLGVYGKVYDEVSSRLESTVDKAPRQWDALVKRGEKVQKDLEKSQSALKAKIKTIDLKESVKGLGKKAA